MDHTLHCNSFFYWGIYRSFNDRLERHLQIFTSSANPSKTNFGPQDPNKVSSAIDTCGHQSRFTSYIYSSADICLLTIQVFIFSPSVIIFNSHNKLFQYASTDMDRILLKYTGTFNLDLKIWTRLYRLFNRFNARIQITISLFQKKLEIFSSFLIVKSDLKIKFCNLNNFGKLWNKNTYLDDILVWWIA